MSATTLHPTSCVLCPSSPVAESFGARIWRALALKVAGALAWTRNQHDSWSDTQTLIGMSAHMLQDIGAPDWVHQRAQLRQTLECREHFKAISRFKY